MAGGTEKYYNRINYIGVHENKKVTIYFKFMDELNRMLEYMEKECLKLQGTLL